MHSPDYAEFLTILVTLAQGMGVEVSDTRIEFYWAALDDVSLETFTGACILAAKYAKKFPLPADLREYGEQARHTQRTQRLAQQRRLPAETTEARDEEGLAAVRQLLDGVLRPLPDAEQPVSRTPGKPRASVYLAPTTDPTQRKAVLREQLAQLTTEETAHDVV